MIELITLGIGLALIGLAFYRWATLNNGYFAKRQLPFLEPNFLVGTSGRIMMKMDRMDVFIRWIYGAGKNSAILGLFDFRSPVYLLRDPALIKQVVVKDFDHFEDHKLFIDPTIDKLFGNSLIMLRGQKWRDMRATLSPAFTGSKMRLMFDMVADCAADMCAELCKQTATTTTTTTSTTDSMLRTDVKDMFSRYSTDVIATAAFGIQINSFTDDQNEFYRHGKRLTANFTTVRSAVKLVMTKLCPSLMRWLDIQFIDRDADRFFRSMVLDTIQARLEKKIYRPDLINLLMQLKANNEGGEAAAEDYHQRPADDGANNDTAGFATVEESQIGKERVQRSWTDLELASQAFLFFVAGFDTTSTLLSFLMYELALNVDVQRQLYEECCASRAQLKNGRLSYDALQRMPYMDQVVSETLRMWPPVLMIDRMCVKDYKYDDGALRFDVQSGMSLWIAVFGLHRDGQYFAEPDRFRPERFSDECKDSIVPGTYLPFGVGPRNCIGSRFALMEIKAIVYHILLNFSVEPTHETIVPMRLAATPGVMKPEKDIILGLKRRSE